MLCIACSKISRLHPIRLIKLTTSKIPTTQHAQIYQDRIKRFVRSIYWQTRNGVIHELRYKTPSFSNANGLSTLIK